MRFFDHNATTPLFPEAKAAWMEANEAHWFNPSSPYRAGAAAHAQLENARERLASLLSLAPTRIIFNSGATEGNNTVFATWAARLGKDSTVAVGMTEHPSVLEAAGRYFEGRIEWQEPSREGVTHPNASLAEDVSAISIMAANNETGVLNPWQDWIEFCRARGIPMHCDASQWIGKMPLDLLSGCDYVTGCAHKFGGPKGVGFLIVPEGEVLGFAGGAQEGGRRGGTEDLPGILSMVTALEVADSRRSSCSQNNKISFLSELQKALPTVEIIADGAPSLWNTAAVILPEFRHTRWIRALERRGFLVSAGSACSSAKDGPSHVLAAMGIGPDRSNQALRISSGWETSVQDWSDLLKALLDSYDQLREEAEGANSRVVSI